MNQNAHGRHHRDPVTVWAAALKAAAGLARISQSTEADVIRAVTTELRRLRLRGGVTLLGPNGKLIVKGRSLSPTVERSLRRLTGLELDGYQFDLEQVEVYRSAIRDRKPVFEPDRAKVINAMTPHRLRSIVPRVVRLLGNNPVIVAPLILDDQILGAINVTASWLAPEDRSMVGALADHVAIALGHVRRREALETSLQQERLRRQVIETVASVKDLQGVLDRVLRLAVEATSAEAGSISLLDEEAKSLTTKHIFNLPDDIHALTYPRGIGLAWEAIENQKPIQVNDYSDTPNADPRWIASGVHAVLGLPLIVGEETVGAMGLFMKHSGRTFSLEQIDRAFAIAQMAAIAVRDARLVAEATQRAEEAQGLIQTARTITSSLDQDTVLREIAERAKELLEADGCRIHLIEDGKDELLCVLALEPNAKEIMAIKPKLGEGLVGHVTLKGQPLLSNRPFEDSRSLQVPGTPENEHETLMLAPLSIRERTMGAMTVRRIGEDRPFLPADLILLTAFAAQAAVAIENANLYGQVTSHADDLELEVAERTRDLAISESKYRSLVESAVAGTFQTDLQANITYVNQSFANLLGYDPEELVGQSVIKLVPPDLAGHIHSRFEDPYASEPPGQRVYETTFLSRNNQAIPALAAISLINDTHDQIQGVTLQVFDISERKSLEAQVQSQRDRLHAILANIGDAVFVMDPEGKIEFVNPAWERLNGFTQQEAVGETPGIMKSGFHTREFYKDMWQTILSGRTWSGEVVNRRKDGSNYDAVVTVQSVSDEYGQVINLVGVQHDISALKHVDRLKSQFVSDVSHELRTPLTNIQLYLDLMQATTDRGKIQTYLDTLIRESERLANLINDLLSLSRLEAGATPFYSQPIDIGELLNPLVEDRKSMAATKGLKLELVLGDEVPQAQADRKLLAQVFTNLLTNAMHYTPEGGKIIIRTSLDRTEKHDWITAVFEDTGIGVRPDEQPLIFERFYRGDSGEITTSTGTGLGLAICKEIVDLHNGRITVRSEGIPGEGSTFTVWLPPARE